VNGVDNTLTKLTGDVLVAVSEQVRHLIGKGLIEPEKLQLTIEARRERAKELVDAGMSQRQAAKVLGVSEGTMRNDLRNSYAENAQKLRTSEDIGPGSKPNFPAREQKREALVRKNEALAGGYLWTAYSHLGNGERIAEIANILAVSQTKIKEWTKEARQGEKEAAQAKAWDLWLDCLSERAIAEQIGVDQATINRWLADAKSASAENASAPASRQHFDVWQFAIADKTAGAQSYFGAIPPQGHSLHVRPHEGGSERRKPRKVSLARGTPSAPWPRLVWAVRSWTPS